MAALIVFAPVAYRQAVLNFSHRKVGGIRFFKLGRLNFSVSMSRQR